MDQIPILVPPPPLFGGYEYTPDNINKRSTELLVDKHNEALSVLPRLFSEHNWHVSFTDTPWLNYSWIADLSILINIIWLQKTLICLERILKVL